MDLRSLIAKMDAIEQTALVQEAEDILTEKVRIRYSDVEAVAKQYPTDEVARGQALAKLAKDNGLPGLFDPVSRELVNPDGSLSTFKGADEATVNQLKQWGLLPLGAKTSSWLGMRGQDEKTAIGANQTAQGRDVMVDKAEALMKKGVESATAAVASESAMVKSGMAESLIKEFGYSHTLLEAISPAEHKELKKLITDLAPFAKTDPDVADIAAQFRAYNQQRDQIIARIKELVAAIKSKKPIQKEDLADIAKGADTVVRGAANLITFGYADQAEAWLNSKLKGTKLQDELKSTLDRTANDEENSPWLYYGGQVGGAILTAPLTGVKAGLAIAGAGGSADYFSRQPGNAAAMDKRTKERQAANPKFDPEVERLQSQLKAMGYKLGTSGPKKDGVDGVLGNKTIAAAKAAKLPLPKPATKKKTSDIPAKKTSTIPTGTASTIPTKTTSTASAPAATTATSTASAPAATTASAPAATTTASTTAANAKVPTPATLPATAKVSTPSAASPEMAGVIKGIQTGLTNAGIKFDPSGNGWINGVAAFAKQKGISPAEALGQLTANIQAESLADSFANLKTRLDAINEGAFDKIAPWVITKLMSSGSDDIARLASTTITRTTPVAEKQAIATAKKIAGRIQAAGPGVGDDVIKAVVKNPDAVIPGATKVATAAVPGAEKAAAGVISGSADDAAKIAADLEYQSWFKVAPAIEKGLAEKFGYRVGKVLANARANSRIVRYMTNPRFLLALAALALAGYAISKLGDFEGEGGNPAEVPGGGTGGTGDATTVTPAAPAVPAAPAAPAEDPEVKLNLSELQKLIDRLNGGWPTDAETAAANADGASVGAKVPGADRAGQAGNPAQRSGVMSAADMLEKDKATAIR